MIEKVISGGQTGADQAGLRAAKERGIPTGGWLPKDCITLEGPRRDLLDLYGMQEHSGSYALRTESNVRDSDGTIRFAKNFKSAGEKCTKRAISWFRKPSIDVDMSKPRAVEQVRQWIIDNNIKVLNVAGNAEETAPGIGQFTYEYLLRLFDETQPGRVASRQAEMVGTVQEHLSDSAAELCVSKPPDDGNRSQ